ncbi:MAG: tape measure protein [Geminicoccaceae bacterium]|uniref:tape measure protein n=1 Tax=Reyranella sp. TaxID=1929291 RepID=UPI003D0ECC0B
MADEVKIIRLVIDSSKAVDGRDAARRAMQDIERSAGSLSSAVSALESTFKRAFAALAAALAVRELVQAIDTFTQLQNAMKVAGLEGQNLVNVQDRLFQIASKNGVEVGALGQLYSRLGMASRELGTSQDQMLKFVEGVSAALRVQGGSTEQASGALLQLSQAMAAGVVRAEEFNSILEGAFPIAQAAARGMAGMEGSVGKLRTAVTDGKVTSQAFFEGLLKGFKETEVQAQASTLTIGGGFTVLKNQWVQFAGEIDKSTKIGGAIGLLGTVLGEALASLTRAAKDGDFDFVGRMIDGLTVRAALLAQGFRQIGPALSAATTTIGDWTAVAQQAFYDLNVHGAAARGRLIDTFTGIGEDLRQIFVDAMNAVLEAVEKGLNALSSIPRPSWFGGGTVNLYDPIRLGRVGGGPPGGLALEPSVAMANEQVLRQSTRDLFGGIRDYRAELEQRRAVRREIATAGDFLSGIDTLTGGGMPPSTPATSPGDKKGQGAADKYKELTEQLTISRDAQNAMTAAARAGDVAFQEQQATLDATQKLYDIFNARLKESDPRLTTVRNLLLDIAQGKAAEAFNVATTELQKQNVILQAQIDLRNELPEVQARELAVIKARQEAEKAGTALTAQDVENRRSAIETNERLKIQAEELKQATELWMEPWKQAWREIQSTAASTFEEILRSGQVNLQSLGETLKVTVRKMIAELLALATVRPIISIGVNALGSLGILSPSTVSSLGVGGGGGGLGGVGTALGLGSLFNASGGSSWLGSVGNWLNTPIIGGFSGVAPVAAGMYGPAPNIAGAAGLTPLGLIGGFGSIGYGAYNLFSGGGSPGSIVSGVGGIIGGGMSLAAGAGLIGSAFGPIGTAVGLLAGLLGGSGLLDGLFGGGYKMPPLVGASTQWAWNGALGGYTNSESSQFGGQPPGSYGVPGKQAALYKLAGGVIDDSKIWGNAIWQNYREGQTTAYVISPSGSSMQWWQGSGNSTPGIEQAGAQSALASLLGGGVATSAMLDKVLKRTFESVTPNSVDQIAAVVQGVIDFQKAMEDLGETTIGAEQAVAGINNSLGALWSFAKTNGLDADVTKIEAFKEKSIIDAAKAFMAPFDSRDPKTIGLETLDRQYEQIRKEASAWQRALNTRPDLYGIDGVEAFFIDMNKIEEKYLQDRKALLEQFTSQSLGSLQDVIRRLAYGDLSGANPADVLSGTRGTYLATLAKANAGDSAAIAALGGATAEYAQAAMSYYGTSTMAYQTLRQELIGNGTAVYAANGGNIADLAPAMAANTQALETVSQQFAALGVKMEGVLDSGGDQQAQIGELLDLMRRIAMKIAA